jgi:nucleotide-binding universal stress UspA family protein
MRLLVGFDGSDGGRDALELARALSANGEASAMVVAVIPYGPLPVRFAELEDEAAAAAAPLLAEARERLAGLEVETRAFGGGSPAWVMTDLAERHQVDLIVVGSPHRGAVGRTLIGSVAEGVLHGAPCAVAVAPRGYAQSDRGPISLIGVAYDGAAEAKAALRRARLLAEATGAAVRVLTVVAPPVALPGVAGYTPVEPPDPDAVLAQGVKGLGTEVAAEGRKLRGPPASTLAGACEDGIDLLLAGSRGYGPVLRVLLGSVSSRLIAEAPCPVMVVPRPDSGGE